MLGVLVVGKAITGIAILAVLVITEIVITEYTIIDISKNKKVTTLNNYNIYSTSKVS